MCEFQFAYSFSYTKQIDFHSPKGWNSNKFESALGVLKILELIIGP